MIKTIWLTFSWTDISPKSCLFFETLVAVFENFLHQVNFLQLIFLVNTQLGSNAQNVKKWPAEYTEADYHCRSKQMKNPKLTMMTYRANVPQAKCRRSTPTKTSGSTGKLWSK